ncbi:hypothetical protein [Xenorhabdus griffiniae]|uniref:hypothetical protein n=1 Tax=Xenorhabdus griffiniae TaxID=351672 RepID=UPI0023591FD7|nr:hypothetical protein [Xenorhabdus griffiniae]MDC9604807.1 hypothetical protein [Xenorhabdus griffiniae]
MPKKLVDPEKINAVFAHLNEGSDNHALYISLMGGTDITNQIRGLVFSPGYRMVRVDGRLGEWISQSHFELALINDVSKEVVYDMISGELHKILTQNDVSSQEIWLWGDPEHYQNRLAIISKNELPIQ